MRRSRTPKSKSALKTLGAAAGAILILTTIFVASQTFKARAASPTSTTLSPTATSPVLGSKALCRDGLTCDTFTLNIGGTAAAWAGKDVRVKIEWNLPVTDYDLYIHKGSNASPLIASSGRGITSPCDLLTVEDTTIDPSASGTGVYTVRAVYYAATTVDQYHGSAGIELKPTTPPAAPTPTPSTATPPSYQNFAAPSGLGESAGEPTIGVNWNSGAAMFISALQTLRVRFNATPNDPVQRGVVCTAGTTCPGSTRNLLDFDDLTIDKRGRALAAFADGCVTAACISGADKNGDGHIDGNDNDGTARATIIRQSGGRSLFAAFD